MQRAAHLLGGPSLTHRRTKLIMHYVEMLSEYKGEVGNWEVRNWLIHGGIVAKALTRER